MDNFFTIFMDELHTDPSINIKTNEKYPSLIINLNCSNPF
jgi:hypothetical protein